MWHQMTLLRLPSRGWVTRAPGRPQASDMTGKPQLKCRAKAQRNNKRMTSSLKTPPSLIERPFGQRLLLTSDVEAPVGVLTAPVLRSLPGASLCEMLHMLSAFALAIDL